MLVFTIEQLFHPTSYILTTTFLHFVPLLIVILLYILEIIKINLLFLGINFLR